MCRVAGPLMRLIDPRQQSHVRDRIAARKLAPPAAVDRDAPGLPVLSDQPRTLRAAQAGHPLHVGPDQSLGRPLLSPILLVAQQRLGPSVDLGPAIPRKPYAPGGRQKRLQLDQAQLLASKHDDHLPLACRFRLILCWNQSRPSGSSCIGQESIRDIFRTVLYSTLRRLAIRIATPNAP